MLDTDDKNFLDDGEKMSDFFFLSKREFLNQYSYITEEEWFATYIKLKYESEV
jgi:hypothetical protein